MISANSAARLAIVALLAGHLVACASSTASDAKQSAGTNATSDAGGAGDALQTADATPPVDKSWRANVYTNDPITDNWQTTEVTLAKPTDPDGKLTGEFANVSNCLQEEGGQAMKNGGFTIGHLCLETQTVAPGTDGSYLQVVPPEDFSDGNDAFAEVQMYHHVNQAHDYFSGQFGLQDLDYPLYALVNVTFQAFGKWQGFPNAAFMPKEAFAQFGLPARDDGAIVFGQYKDTDFCYDASVIYHEYTHAIVGTTRLSGTLIDQTGLDNLPGAMNEGFADYFSCSIRESSLIGPYALTFAGQQYQRDLSQMRKCPDDLTSEIHADGKIIGSALWDLRGKLGRDMADSIILGALQQFGKETNLEAAAKLILAEAKGISDEAGATTKEVLDNHGMLGCVRAKELKDFVAAQTDEQLPYSVESKSAFGGGSGAFPDGVPGYIQFWVDPPKGKTAATITFSAMTQGGMGGFGGGGGSVASLRVAVRKGKQVVLNLMSNGAAVADAKVVPAKNKQGVQTFTLGADCLQSGVKTYLMFLSNEEATARIDEMKIQYLDSASGASNVVSCTK